MALKRFLKKLIAEMAVFPNLNSNTWATRYGDYI